MYLQLHGREMGWLYLLAIGDSVITSEDITIISVTIDKERYTLIRDAVTSFKIVHDPRHTPHTQYQYG